MASAREILDERLARGEITQTEHEALAARLAGGANTKAGSPSVPAALTGSTAWNIGGAVVAIIWAGLTSNVVNSVIERCVESGSTQALCRASAVNWPMVYGSYTIAAIVGVWSLAAIVLHKRAGTAGEAPR